MIEVTPDALELCTATVRQLSTQPNTKCLRLIERNDGIAMSFELPRTEDELLRHKGMPVLAIPEETASVIADKTLDVQGDGRFFLS